MENHADVGIPKKTLMRTPLTVPNPPYIKSGTDGLVYKQTGRKINAPYVKPRGQVYVVPPKVAATGYDVLKPFIPIMDKKLKEKGLTPPSSIEDKAKLFHNHIVAAKGFNGTKPLNFESYDHADPEVQTNVLDTLVTYFKSLNSGVQPNGQPLTTQDAALSKDVKNVVQDLAAKVAGAGYSPVDAAAAGAALSNAAPLSTPFYKTPVFKWSAIAVAAIIVLVILTR
jgi:hypothetical protein